MKKLILATVFAVVATPALALGPEAFSVDISSVLNKGGSWQATPPQQEQQQRSQAQSQPECQDPNCPSQEEANANQQGQPQATKASGSPRKGQRCQGPNCPPQGQNEGQGNQ